MPTPVVIEVLQSGPARYPQFSDGTFKLTPEQLAVLDAQRERAFQLAVERLVAAYQCPEGLQADPNPFELL